MLLNPFCPLTTAKVLALKATVLLLLTLLIKARVQILAGSALGIALLLLQALVFLAVSGGLVLAASGAVLFAADAPALATSWLFRAKLALVVLAAANAAAFELLKTRRLPTAVFAATSLGLWLAVAVAGRMIAYV